MSKLLTRRKLGELCSVVTKGTTPTSLGMAFEDEGVPFLRIQNLFGSSVHLKDILYISEDTHNALNRSKIMAGDFLITIAGTIGRVAIVPDDFPEANCNQAVAILRFDKSKLFPRYLLHWLTTNDALQQISGKKVTATISNLSLGQIKEFEIPLPPLDEQKRIAAILDKADAIRRKRQQAIQLADDFLRSVFLDMFGDPVTWNKNDIAKGWTVKPIEEISLLKRGYDLPKQSRLEGNIPIYAANGITGTHNEFKVKGPGVITGRSGTIGKVIYSENDFWPLNTALYVTNFYGNNPKYIEWYLRFLNLERYVQGAGVPTLNRNLFLKEVSAVPPKAEQDRFEVICKLVSQLIFKNLDFNKKELFNSLSQKAFAGEL